tara:strand:- start:4316 stop:6130 length:1815 start_codon:yes stop_codon:yes gene_type:complete
MLKISKSKELLKDLISNLPKKPGIYKFLDKNKSSIYIGKAKNIRKRVSSYFKDSEDKRKKNKKLLSSSKFLDITLTNTELEALLLEQHLIKEERPKFNVQFKDDKGYPWIQIEETLGFPSAKAFLGKKNKESKFFGPYPSSYAVKEALKLIQKSFQIRNCSDSFFSNRTRPCIQHEIGRCSAPCINLINQADYIRDVNSAEMLLKGKSEDLVSGFYDLMDGYSKEKNYEKAALYRDRISALRDIQRSQSISGYHEETDAICVVTSNGQTKIGITHVNQGWVVSHENFSLKTSQIEGNILESFIGNHYLGEVICPSKIIVNQELGNKILLQKALSKFHRKKIRIVSKLNKKDSGLLQINKSNTELTFRGSVKLKETASAIASLCDQLNLPNTVKLIESYDISHHSGSSAVAGCVAFSQKGKLKDKYRLFNISLENRENDIASMLEVIQRRFKKKYLLHEIPDLIIIDGGRTHLKKVVLKLEELDLSQISVISISKGARRKSSMDLIHLQDGTTKEVERGSLAHLFIQEIRDETHRFSINNQKKKQIKTSLGSSLDDIIGIGNKKKKLLLRHFGTLEQIKRASVQDLKELPGFGKKTATSIHDQLH